MLNRDPRCVYVADSVGMASLIAMWLTANDFPAQAMDLNTLGGLEGLTPYAVAVSTRGIEVWVTHPEHAEPARAILADNAERIAAEHAKKADQPGLISAVCEECGKPTEFPAAQQGSVQECPHCMKWIDVPDPNENWDETEEELPED